MFAVAVDGFGSADPGGPSGASTHDYGFQTTDRSSYRFRRRYSKVSRMFSVLFLRVKFSNLPMPTLTFQRSR